MNNNINEKDILGENQFLRSYLIVKGMISFLLGKWKIILFVSMFGAAMGLFWSISKGTVYISTLTFVTEEEKSVTPALGSAAGLASSLGIDLGGGGGSTFNGNNLMELMKSRLLIEKALLKPMNMYGKTTTSLADYLVEVEGMKEKEKDKIFFDKNSFYPIRDRSKYSFKQDSILTILYDKITAPKHGMLSVFQKDKKVNILSVEVRSKDEFFSKIFAEILVNEVSDFYIQTKSRRTKQNVEILEKQVDSVRNKLNEAISGVASASDYTFNLNSALTTMRTPSQKRQVDVQVNTVILTQLIANLEMAKVSLRKETPLIQVIDHPILPLKRITYSKKKYLLIGGIAAGFLIVSFLLGLQYLQKQIKLVSSFDRNISLND